MSMPGLLDNSPHRRLFSLLIGTVLALATFGPNLSNAAEAELAGVQEARQETVDGKMLLIDIRRPDEWQESGIPDVAIELDMRASDFLEKLLALIEKNPGKRLGFICAVGSRSRYLSNWLSQRGIGNIVNVSAGVHGRNGWLANRLPVRKPS